MRRLAVLAIVFCFGLSTKAQVTNDDLILTSYAQSVQLGVLLNEPTFVAASASLIRGGPMAMSLGWSSSSGACEAVASFGTGQVTPTLQIKADFAARHIQQQLLWSSPTQGRLVAADQKSLQGLSSFFSSPPTELALVLQRGAAVSKVVAYPSSKDSVRVYVAFDSRAPLQQVTPILFESKHTLTGFSQFTKL